MPARVANIAPCITQVTFKLVHYALLIYQLRFVFTFLKVLANFPTDKYGLDCGLELNAKVFQLCDTGSYVGYTRGHLHARVDGHKSTSSSIRKHYDSDHAGAVPEDLLSCFKVIKKCRNKFDCLVNEMLYIKQLTPSLNVQTDSIRAKVFV